MTRGEEIKMATNRRRFLQMTTASVAAAVVTRHVLGGLGYVAPSERVNVALVGAGGQGRTNIHGILKHNDAQAIAVADPIEQEDLSRLYHKGTGGPPTRAGRNRKALSAAEARVSMCRVRRLP